MAQSGPSSEEAATAVVIPALKVGCVTGLSGALVGGVAGIVRSSTPVLFAAASGLQCFALGTTYWASRGAILHAWQVEKNTSGECTAASTIAGAFTGGSIGLLTRGKANFLPGVVMFSAFGFVGQSIYNSLHVKKASAIPDGQWQGEKPNIWKRVAESRWTPVKYISDEDYQKMLEEKLLNVEAEIAVLDEDIEKLRDRRGSPSSRD